MDRRQFSKIGAIGLGSLLAGSAVLPGRACAAGGFADVPSGHWLAAEGILDFLVNRDIIHGVDGYFLPDACITREDAAVIVYNAFTGAPSTASYAQANCTGLGDVAGGQYYTCAVNWCCATGVARGYANADGTRTRFGVGDLIPREQIACMLRNAVSLVFGIDCPAQGGLGKFPDSGDVSSWALESVSWAVGLGIVEGAGGYLMPKDDTTRAQMAKMVYRTLIRVDPYRAYTNLIYTPNADEAVWVMTSLGEKSVRYYKNPAAPLSAYKGVAALSGDDGGAPSPDDAECVACPPSTGDQASVRAIVGDDSRVPVENTTVFPYRCIGPISATVGLKNHHGTASMVSRNAVITAAHCLFDGESGTIASSAFFELGKNGTDRFAAGNSAAIGVSKRYYDIRGSLYDNALIEQRGLCDIGFVVFDSLEGHYPGFLGSRPAHVDEKCDTSGYPGDLSGGLFDTQWECSGKLVSIEGYLAETDADIDVAKGQSGSALRVIGDDGDYAYVTAILSYQSNNVNGTDPHNYATRLIGQFSNIIRSLRVNGEG